MESKCTKKGSSVEVSSLVEPSISKEIEESGCGQRVSNHYKLCLHSLSLVPYPVIYFLHFLLEKFFRTNSLPSPSWLV